ncbi:hypothetical protein [Mycolicibacterium bacteremicum]|uniref:hypothetical protein n=1 Tax=Mycolicibacterium bacteremicum TaxID=564198 RepID=UPI001054F26A|nr:hypothetical protein [Mycolicibacterium bacteremicum]MCV7430018.1 hypothetical protein [Mycolicibacterium bacteremicum]
MRVAAAVCLVCSGLLIGTASSAIAFAEPDTESEPSGDRNAGAETRPQGAVSTRAGLPRPRVAAPPIGRRGQLSVTPDPAGKTDPETGDSKLPQEPGEASPGEPAADAGELPADPNGTDEATGDDRDTADQAVREPADPKDPKDPDDDECGWWWPSPPDGGFPSSGTGDGYDGGAAPPAGRPAVPPAIDLPGRPVPEIPLAAANPGPSVPAPGPAVPAALPMPMPPLPVAALPPAAPGAGGAGRGGASGGSVAARPAPPATRGAPPAERPAPPRSVDAVPASYRAGYGEHLRTAPMSTVAAMAVPGATGIMLLTGVGGLIGYRQARAGLTIRSTGSGRFVS